MPAIVTPFDSFVRDVNVWMSQMWFLWAILALATVAAVVVAALCRARARERARIPQYRRH